MPPINRTAVKAKNLKKSLFDLLRYCKRYLPILIVATIFTIASTMASVFAPTLLGKLSDTIKEGIYYSFDTDRIITLIETIAIIHISSNILSFFVNFIMAYITSKVSKNLRRDIFAKINRVPLSYYDKNKYGDTLSRITNDVDTISQTLNGSISTLIAAFSTLVGCLVMMFITNYILAFTAIISTVIGFIIVGVIMSKSQKYFVMRQKEIGRINGHIEEIYSNQTVVRLYNGEEKSKNKFDSINKNVKAAEHKSQFFSGLMQPLMGFVGNLGLVLVAVIGTLLVVNGMATFGVIITFIIFARIFSTPLSQIAQGLTNLQSAGAASERVFEFLNEEELKSEENKKRQIIPSKVKGDIEFKDVRFGYNRDKIIIHDFSAKIKAGSKVAIVGPTGAGKTTMVNLLMNFYELDGGDIFIDGINTKELKRDNIHNIFGMVLQDTWTFEGSIYDNLRFNNEKATNEDIENACKTIGLDHFIRSLPESYDTILNDATSISAGQKQLLTIARAMIQNSPMLILDEATSNVDTRTEELIQKAMDKLTHGRTSFVIAHRLSTIKNADMILVMDNGDIIEKGSHNELLKKNGFYANLYNSQFEN